MLNSDTGQSPSDLAKTIVHQLWPELTFQYTRSSGAGGQNVNKVSSKVSLRWNVLESECLVRVLGLDKALIIKNKLRPQLTDLGDLLIVCDEFRDQPRNKARTLEKVEMILLKVLTPVKKRIKTKPTKSAKRKRLATKREHKEKKIQRQKVNW